MPTKRVEFPDGTVRTIEHPEGATEEQIINFARQEFENQQFANSLQSPTEDSEPTGGSAADAIGQGLTFGFADELAGIAGAAVGTFDPNLEGTTFGERYRGIRDSARDRLDAFRERNPIGATALEIGGALPTGGVGAARAGAFQAVRNAPSAARALAPIARTGATQGAIFGAGSSRGETAQDIAQDTAVGGAIGGITAPLIPALAGGAKSGASRAFQVTSDSPTFQKAARILKDKVGIDTLTTGQRTGSNAIRSAETSVSETVFGGSIGRRLDQNRRKLQTKLMRMAGFPDEAAQSGEVTQDALNAAKDRFRERYTSILGGKRVDISGDDFLDDLANIEATHSRMLPFEQKRQIRQIIDDFIDEATGGPISGEDYQRIRSNLGILERRSANNPTTRDLYTDLKHALDDAFADNAATKAAKREIDREYNRFTKIRDTFEGSGSIQTSSGDLPLASLLRKAAKRGKGADEEFNEIIRAGQTVLGDPTPNSATASRLGNLLFFGQGGLGALLGGADAGLLGAGVPILSSQALSRGVTGSGAANRAVQSGLLTAPTAVPLFTD